MKEDKLDQEIAASIKKKLAEATVPYQLGAWESFQKKRAQRKRKSIVYWACGVAASLLLVLVGVNSVDFSNLENTNAEENHLAKSTEGSSENVLEEFPISEADTQEVPMDSSLSAEIESKSIMRSTDGGNLAEIKEIPSTPSTSLDASSLATVPDPLMEIEDPKKSKPSVLPSDPAEKSPESLNNSSAIRQPTLITTSEEVVKAERSTVEKSSEERLALLDAEKAAAKPDVPTTSLAIEEKQSFVAESNFPEIEAEKTQVNLGMGVTPGFGTVQGDNQMAVASTIGLGMLVDIKLPGKVTLGSGLGLNYLSQNSEQESTVMAFGKSYPQTEKLEVRQMQVELPVFVRYPVTRNNSVSIQAGFSNFYAVNESANQENTSPQQMAYYSSHDALGSTSVSFRQESVTESTPLENKSGRFYPFATVNFGVNLRVLETKGANYVIMPFYNYQVKQVSGYGDTFGLFGASFKMNFGGSK